MMKCTRWLLLAILGATILGCGGQSDPADNIEFESGVLFTNSFGVAGTTRLNAVKTGLFIEDGSMLTRNVDTIRVLKIIDFDFGDSETEILRDYLEIGFSVSYLNELLEPVSFSLNRADLDELGYNIVIRSKTDGKVVWDLQNMVNWCTSLSTEIKDAFELNEITDTYTEPGSLEAKGTWSNSDDARVIGCLPLWSIIVNWIGRDIQDIQDHIEQNYQNYESLNELLISAYTDVDLVPDLQVAEGEEPTNVEFEVELQLTMNEFVNSDPVTFTLVVEPQETTEEN